MYYVYNMLVILYTKLHRILSNIWNNIMYNIGIYYEQYG